MNGHSTTVSVARSLRNPWSGSSCLPDGSQGISCFTVKETGTLTTGATGTCYGILVGVGVNNQFKLDTGTTGAGSNLPTVSGNWSNATGISTVDNMFGKFRVVSAGLKIVYTGNTINDGGVLVMGQISGNVTAATLNAMALQTLAGTTQNYKTYPLRQGGMITWRPSDKEDMDGFQPINGATPTATTAVVNAPYLMAYVYGAQTAGASICQYEFVVNYEGQIQSQFVIPGGLGNGVTTPPAETGWYENAMNLVRQVPTIVPLIAQGLEFATGSSSKPLRSLLQGTSRSFNYASLMDVD